MKIHELKILPQYYVEVFLKKKRFELRKNDRDFKVGDILILKEWNPESGEYTGNRIVRTITYILSNVLALEEGYVILSIK